MGVKAFLDAGEASPACEEKLRQMADTKEHCAEWRRRILTLLNTEMLISDARGDVLRLLGELFELLDETGDNHESLVIEHPGGTHLDVREDFEDLNSITLKCVRAVITAARTLFRDPAAVRDTSMKFESWSRRRIKLHLVKKADLWLQFLLYSKDSTA